MFMHSIDDNRIYKVTKPAQIKHTEVQKGGVQKVDIKFSTGNIHLHDLQQETSPFASYFLSLKLSSANHSFQVCYV